MKVYKWLCVHLGNTLVFLFAANLLAFVLIEALFPDTRSNVVTRKYGVDLAVYYPGMSPADIDTLLQETWSRNVRFEPFTQFAEPASTGRFVNVGTAGFRRGKEQAPWPIDEANFNVFVFGGSTTFGIGLPDHETIPVALQDRLNGEARTRPVRVYNFGRSHYYSSQERALFVRLLVSDVNPDAVVFIDGLNDFYYHADEPNFTEQFVALTEGRFSTFGSSLLVTLRQMPITRFANDVAVSIGVDDTVDTESAVDEAAVIDTVLSRFERNRRVIRELAAAYGVEVLFVWQPVPTYRYDLSQHVFSREGFGLHALSGPGYETVTNRGLATVPPDVIWCGDAHERSPWPHYLDIVHYTASMSKAVADCIVERSNGQLSDRRSNTPADSTSALDQTRL